jgi:hypothetical protein
MAKYNAIPTKATMPSAVVDDSKLFEDEKEFHFAPEQWASGNLPAQPSALDELPIMAVQSTPWKNLR